MCISLKHEWDKCFDFLCTLSMQVFAMYLFMHAIYFCHNFLSTWALLLFSYTSIKLFYLLFAIFLSISMEDLGILLQTGINSQLNSLCGESIPT